MKESRPVMQTAPSRHGSILDWLIFCTVLGLVGCQGTGTLPNLGRGAPKTPKADPLLGMRLPPQDVPLGGSGPVETAQGPARDPLLRLPEGKSTYTSTGEERAGQPGGTGTGLGPGVNAGVNPGNGSRGGARGASEDVSAVPPKQGPYKPGPKDSPAALAPGKFPPKTNELAMDRLPPTPAAMPDPPGTKPAAPANGGVNLSGTFDELASRLKSMKVVWNGPFKQGEQYMVLADVPLTQNPLGAKRRYNGFGPSPAGALKDVLGQILSDRK